MFDNILTLKFNIDGWTIFGFFGQGVYFLRFFVQWLYSEKLQRSAIPDSFWPISILGAICLFVYSVARSDLVFMIGSVLSMLIYIRNYYFVLRSKSVGFGESK